MMWSSPTSVYKLIISGDLNKSRNFGSLVFLSTRVCVYIMARRKDINHDLREADVAHQPWKGYKAIANNLKFTLLQ